VRNYSKFIAAGQGVEPSFSFSVRWVSQILLDKRPTFLLFDIVSNFDTQLIFFFTLARFIFSGPSGWRVCSKVKRKWRSYPSEPVWRTAGCFSPPIFYFFFVFALPLLWPSVHLLSC
jgi:hypothetical protein